MGLCACSTKTITKIEYITIPEKYLQCDKIPKPRITKDAQTRADTGDFKLFAIELVEDRMFVAEPWHNECVRNAKSARDYQNQMKGE